MTSIGALMSARAEKQPPKSASIRTVRVRRERLWGLSSRTLIITAGTLAITACIPHMGSSSILLDPSNAEWTRPAPAVSHLTFETTKGTFTLELVRANGPIGADRLYNLARLG